MLLPKLTIANDLQTVGRLIVGLGSENVLETGIRLHHTFGMPIIPGSALKGLAAHFCNEVWGENDERFKNTADYHQLLFGTNDESGCIIFHDAWFVPESEVSPLKLDVMTPHHPNWLDGSEPPTDFDSPIPVPFLSVAGQFHVAVSWYGPEHVDAEKWTKLAMDLLCNALSEWGVGGKTTSGYGRLVAPPPPPPAASYKGKPGDSVVAVLLAEKTKKGGWKAQIKGFSQIGPIQNTEAVPAGLNPGDEVRLTLASINDREVAYKWPPSAKG
jgi:CRISPR type III-B/RAMP module RAMP protein Cmr6